MTTKQTNIIEDKMEQNGIFEGDPSATWNYWWEFDIKERGIPIEWIWERLRKKRDNLLLNCDFRVVSDAQWDVTPWLNYRQKLRDLPANTTNPTQAIWPEIPKG